MATIDLNIIPLYLQGGQDYTTLPGLHVANPSNKASRSRRNDYLILLLDFVPPAFSDDRLAELLTRLETMYYEKSGSTVSAMRELIEDLNTLILNLNLRHAGNREQVTGAFGVVVIRNGHFFLAQCGAGHLFALMPGKVDYLHDDSLAERGLGVSRSPSIYYAQMEIDAGFKFIYSKQLPDGWDAETFQYAYTNPLHNIRRRFLEDAGEELKGFLLNTTAGQGKAALQEFPRILPEQPAKQPAGQPAPQTAPPQAMSAESAAPAETYQTDHQPTGGSPLPSRVEPTPLSSQPAPTYSTQEPAAVSPADTTEDEEPPASETSPRRRTPSRERAPQIDLRPAMLNFLKGAQGVWQKVAGVLKSGLQRLVPGEELVKIPSSYMAFIAIFVPLIVVTISALVYAQVGRNTQYENYFGEAQTLYAMASQETDTNLKYTRFIETMEMLDRAESYLITDEVTDLRDQTQAQMDLIDNVTRLDFEQAIAGTLSNQITIRKIAATSREVYFLDTTSDSVFRAWLAGTQFEMDPDFKCSAGPYSSIIIKDLVDIAILPENPNEYDIVAIDAGGNLLYCKEDANPTALSLVPPDNNWGEIEGIVIENDRLYVLDEKLNMVWYYRPSLTEDNDINYLYEGQPNFFFVEEVPTLKGSIDFVLDQEELYLLFENGETTTCTFSGMNEAPTTCDAPTAYNDTRPGKTSGPKVEGAVFYQLQNTDPPEPSLYYLDPAHKSIYHFSLRLNLVEVYRPQPELEGDYISAFAVSPTNTIFIAMENKVYLAYLP